VEGWPQRDVEALIGDWDDQVAAALVLWAMWSCETLEYLTDLDAAAFDGEQRLATGYPLDLAHVRWATTTAISAIDLCAASAGRRHFGYSNGKEADLERLVKKAPLGSTGSTTQDAVIEWRDSVRGSDRYPMIRGLRNAITHSRPVRMVPGTAAIVDAPALPPPRASFVGKGAHSYDSRDIIEKSRQLAHDAVDSYLTGLSHGFY
jgi:hypothetical protein